MILNFYYLIIIIKNINININNYINNRIRKKKKEKKNYFLFLE